MPGRSATLGIEDEGRVVQERQRRREVDDRGGLPHPALPIRHRDHPARRLAHEAPPWNLRPGEKKKTRLRASLRSPRLAASRTPIDRLGGPSVDSRAPNAHRRPQGSHLLAGPAEGHATERSKINAGGDARLLGCRRRARPSGGQPVAAPSGNPDAPYARNRQRTGMRLIPPTKLECIRSTGPASSTRSSRATRRLKISCSSSRARFAPRQKWTPMPKP